ncbi:unnamed protein product [Blepharisma stoltei]|uniref:Thioredoxin-like fold domain-containing protein n=1 Tax=Blepharisma stoltei TaxID=1481888 RepID=A0AAU9JZW0_9CILI|nr:unnamed protein product [Blepharisma stoltei]
MKALFGPYLFGKAGLVESHILDLQPLILLYFSSSTWFPCREFTPKLIDFYNKVNTPTKQAEIVLIPWDMNETD